MKDFIVLQYQPWRESDWLLDVLSEQGRQRLTLNRPQPLPDLFTLYRADWSAQNFSTIKGWQALRKWPLQDMALYCGLYLNEVIGLLLPEQEPTPTLFQAYREAIEAFANGQLPDPWLRLVEGRLLQTIGSSFAWNRDAAGQPIQEDQYYQFINRQGFVPVNTKTAPSAVVCSSEDLYRIYNGTAGTSLHHWRMIKTIMRMLLEDVLPRPLISRELLNSLSQNLERK